MLRIERISHAYGEIVSLRAVSLAVAAGEILCLLGPSGCGKTTLLRIIAGLEAEYDGLVAFDGEDIRPIPTHRRGFGLMFQDFALFPHLSVAGNIAYGLRRLGLARGEIERRTRALLRQVGLEELERRDVNSLSGGQKQRVALARSLAPNPRLLMLDEPLGSLDALLRDQLALELRRIIKGAGLSAIYVTHDHREAYAVADRIAVMNMGSVRQHGRPRQVYRRPANVFVARFLGMRNIFSADDSRIAGLPRAGRFDPIAGAPWMLIHPAGISLSRAGQGRELELRVRLEGAVFRGGHYDVSARSEDGLPLSFALKDLPSTLNQSLSLYIAPEAIIPLAD